MADSISVTVDAQTVKDNLVVLPECLKPYVRAAARISADHIRDEARVRLQRQLSAAATGETVASIRVTSDRSGWGWTVRAGKVSFPMIAYWLERGTEHQRARPYLDVSARLEQEAHTRRIEAAIRAGLAESGFHGDGA